MDLVYICRKGDNEELRYSIRSATQNLEHTNVWVIGGKPSWYIGPHIPVLQNQQKYINAKNNLKHLIKSTQISDNFILMNDDFFILKPVKLGYYYSGTLQERIERNKKLSPNANYLDKLKTTKEMLESQGIENPLDYSLHIPMKMDKLGLAESLDYPLIRSGYGNLQKVGGRKHRDVKVYSGEMYQGLNYELSQNSKFLSTEDNSFLDVKKNVLDPLFPEPTKYERQR